MAFLTPLNHRQSLRPFKVLKVKKASLFHIYVKYLSYICVIIKKRKDMSEVELVLVNDTDNST